LVSGPPLDKVWIHSYS